MALETTRLPPIEPGKVEVKLKVKNTVVHPFDAAPHWFPDPGIGASNVRVPNEVVAYIDGHMAFKDIAAAIRTASRPGHFIYLLGWELVTDFELVPPVTKGKVKTPGITLEGLLLVASHMLVDIRVMLMAQSTEESVKNERLNNIAAVNFINSLFTGKAILDDRVLRGTVFEDEGNFSISAIFAPHTYIGVHHQKILIVNGNEGLIAFQGGMDLNPNRLRDLHDVHTRHRGTAADALLEIFLDRWKDHPQSKNFSPIPIGEGRGRGLLEDNYDYYHGHPQRGGWIPKGADDHLEVAVGRTFPNSTKHQLYGSQPNWKVGLGAIGTRPYDFAPQGDRSAKELVLNAIGQSRKFIYIEEQYLTDMSISDALRDALPNLQKLIILITDSNAIKNEQRQPYLRRKYFIENLTGGKKLPTDKVIVCIGRQYVHSKTFIFDDEFLITGSANLTRRGYTHDSEQNVGIFDTNKGRRFFFAHEVRMYLWAKHLQHGYVNLDDPKWFDFENKEFKLKPIELVNPFDSSIHWHDPHPDANIKTYVVDGTDPPRTFREELATRNQEWDLFIDPDGS
jgi:phosphatidylserine/phosphatidylglycerophosphate/cardiolipin synthase-like enzyme